MKRLSAFVAAGAALAGTAVLPAVGLHDDQVRVETVRIAVQGRAPMDALLVRPGREGHKKEFAGIVDLHWFEPGHATADNSEFLAEAVTLAGRGVVSVLPQQRFPWDFDPVGDGRDRTAVLNGAADVRAALDYLTKQHGVDPGRLGLVGHDYGAMFASMVAQSDHRVRAAALEALDARWANWFDLFWLDLSGDAETAYFALFKGLDPVDNVQRLGNRLMLQWSDNDFFIPAEVRAQFATAAPQATAKTYSRTDHSMDLVAIESDRIAFLAGQLRF